MYFTASLGSRNAAIAFPVRVLMTMKSMAFVFMAFPFGGGLLAGFVVPFPARVVVYRSNTL